MKALSSGTPNLVDFVLENVQVVGGCHSNHIIFGVPGSVEDLLIEVQAVHADLVLLPLAPCGHFARFERSPRFAALPGRLQCDVPPGVAVKHSEEVVVGAGHDGTGRGGEEHGKGVKADCQGYRCKCPGGTKTRTCRCRSSSTRTCRRCSRSHTKSRVYCEGIHEPETNTS